MKYASVICGGTFDGMHRGHVAILTKAFEIGDRVTIGLTSDEYVVKFKYQSVHFLTPDHNFHLYRERESKLMEWLTENRLLHRATIQPIDDPYGPTVPLNTADPGAHQAIVVSQASRETADQINALRARAGWPTFDVVEVPLVLAEDGQPIASERIRDGEIDGNGKLMMPDELRPEMQKPLGSLVMREVDIQEHVRMHISSVIITVGDVATKKLLDMSVMPTLAIIDLRVGRRPFQSLEDYRFPQDAKICRVVSGPGYISKEALETIKLWSIEHKRNHVVVVEGEEDLLVLPVVLLAPLGSIVYYGQPKVGMVVIEVTESKRAEAKKYLEQFIR